MQRHIQKLRKYLSLAVSLSEAKENEVTAGKEMMLHSINSEILITSPPWERQQLVYKLKIDMYVGPGEISMKKEIHYFKKKFHDRYFTRL